MSNNNNVLFLREEYGDGQGTYIYPNGGETIGEFKENPWNTIDYDKNGNILRKIVNGEIQ